MAYELVAVARANQSAAAPTLTEVGPIVAPSITWTRRLNDPGTLAFSVNTDRQSSDVRSRLLDLRDAPTEVWLYRDGTLIFQSAIFTYQIQGTGGPGHTLSATCPGVLAYLGYMHVVSDLTYTGVDQFTIAAGLIDQWQDLTYGNFGIDLSTVGTSGVTRDREYKAVERHNVLQRVQELGRVINGFDVDLDHATRKLVLSYPSQGSDLSGSVFLDARNISDAGVSVSVAPGDIASEAYGIGTGPEQEPITSTQANTALRAAFGRTGVTETFDGVSVQATLDGHTEALLDARAEQVFTPAAGLIPMEDADVGSFDVGDTVTYRYDSGLGLMEGAFRVAELQVSVDQNGSESMAVSFS